MKKTVWVCLCLAFSAIVSMLLPVPVQAAVELSPSSLNFGSVAVNTTSSSATVVITNTGHQSVLVQQISSNLPEFVVSGVTLPLMLSPRSATSFFVVFQPDAAVTYSGKIYIAVGSLFRNSESISVTGTGIAATASPAGRLTPSTSNLTFGNTLVGNSASQSISITNTGTGSVTVSQVSVSGAAFSVSGFWGAVTLAGGQSLALTASFTPATTGSATGTLTVTSNATNSPTTIALSGTGVQSSSPTPPSPPGRGNQPQISVTPGSASFGSVNPGTTGMQTLTISNPGNADLIVIQASLSGASFAFSGLTLPMVVPPGGSSPFAVSFTPAAAGAYSGTLTLMNNSRTPAMGVSLSGAGVAQVLQLSASPNALSFGNVATGTSAIQTVTLTNTGNASVSLSQATMTGSGFTVSGLSLPVTLAAGQSTSFSVSFAPTAAGSVTGAVTITSNAGNSPTTITLSGTGIQPLISMSPASANFGSVNTGASGTQTLTISNPGTANLAITQASLSGAAFAFSGLTVPVTIAPGGSSSFTVSFAPTVAGTSSGTLTLVNNSPTPSLAVSLSGTGVAQALQLSASPTSLSFGNVTTGTTSATQSVTLTNTGNGNVSLSQDSVTGSGFTVTGLSLPVTLAAGQSTSFSVAFAPTAAGSASGSVSITSNAANSPATIALSGTGVQPQISVTPASASFGSVTIGVTNTQTLTISNHGAANLSVSQASLSGAGFAFSGLTVPLTIAPGGSSSFTVSFAPTAVGASSGTLTLVNNSPTPSLAVSLSGTGVAQELQLSDSPTSLTFGNVTTGTTSATQSVTLTNAGNGNISLSQDSVTGSGFTVSGLSLPVTLAAGQSTSFSMAFAPTAAGSVSGSVSITSNATNSPTTVSLSGTGVSTSYKVTLTWTPSSSSYSGFNVYRSNVSGGPYSKIDTSLVTTPTYTDTNVTNGQTYYYVATEVDTSGVESNYSSETSANIP